MPGLHHLLPLWGAVRPADCRRAAPGAAQPRPYPAGEAAAGNYLQLVSLSPEAAAVVRTAVSVSEAGNVKAGSKNGIAPGKFPPNLAAMESLLPQVTADSFQDTLPTCSTRPGQTTLSGGHADWLCTAGVLFGCQCRHGPSTQRQRLRGGDSP